MATRRKSSGFTTPQEEEAASVEEFLDESAQEMFETFSQVENEPEEKAEVVVPEQFIPLEIVPTDNTGPRFVEEIAVPRPQPEVSTPAPQLQPPPKRHPRNVPKFSRYK